MKRASLVAQRLKRLPAMRETWVRSLGQEDQLEKEMATHSSILAWRIPWMEEPGGLQSTGSHAESDTTEQLHLLTYLLTAWKHRSLGSTSGVSNSVELGWSWRIWICNKSTGDFTTVGLETTSWEPLVYSISVRMAHLCSMCLSCRRLSWASSGWD